MAKTKLASRAKAVTSDLILIGGSLVILGGVAIAATPFLLLKVLSEHLDERSIRELDQ